MIILVPVNGFLVKQFNYIDKRPFQKQLEPNFNWTGSQLPLPRIWLSHSWIAFDDHAKQSQWDDNLHIYIYIYIVLKSRAILHILSHRYEKLSFPIRQSWRSIQFKGGQVLQWLNGFVFSTTHRVPDWMQLGVLQWQHSSLCRWTHSHFCSHIMSP